MEKERIRIARSLSGRRHGRAQIQNVTYNFAIFKLILISYPTEG